MNEQSNVKSNMQCIAASNADIIFTIFRTRYEACYF